MSLDSFKPINFRKGNVGFILKFVNEGRIDTIWMNKVYSSLNNVMHCIPFAYRSGDTCYIYDASTRELTHYITIKDPEDYHGKPVIAMFALSDLSQDKAEEIRHKAGKYEDYESNDL